MHKNDNSTNLQSAHALYCAADRRENCFRWHVYPRPPVEENLSQLQAAKFTDFAFKATDGTRVDVHRAVLVGKCSHFESLLAGKWTEMKEVWNIRTCDV
jgi:hypothetical protein